MEDRKTRLAVLGGGPASLTAVYWLTSDEELRDRYDITVYQMGWRLGGKGASGRDANGRIEEHGLHLLFGFYENFFYMVRQAFADLDRPEGHPLRTWRQAFHPHDFACEESFIFGEWHPWLIAFPGNSGVPGSGGALLTPRQYLAMAVQFLAGQAIGWRLSYWLTQKLYPRGEAWESAEDPPLGGEDSKSAQWLFRMSQRLLLAATHTARWLRKYAPWTGWLYKTFRRIFWPIAKRLASKSVRMHRLWFDIDNGVALLTGIIVDEVLLPGGFEKIDELDYRKWLCKHGIHKETLSTNLVRTIYDAAFSYEDGDPAKQRIAAGTAVRALLRAAWTYKGAGYYRMHAGMGDIVFTPLYQILRKRGVKFEFFHKVEALHVSEDGESIDRISVNRQALVQAGVDEYYPLVTIKGVECWPSKPDYPQIEDPNRERREKDPRAIERVNLESYYDDWIGEQVELRAGEHYDEVIFGIPVAAVNFLCRDLIENPRTPAWRDMAENVVSVQTVSFQTWMKKDLESLGWTYPEPLLSLFVEPLNTWADMSQVIPFENWPPGLEPRDVSYFTGAQPGPKHPPLPTEDPEFQTRMTTLAKKEAIDFLLGRGTDTVGKAGMGGITNLMPRAVSPFDPPSIDWNLLIDPRNRRGEARFDSQYWRSNCGPSERCTLALPGTNRLRMKAGETGYDNLYVTGDWTDNNLYCAFMEATIQSGILTARAVAGREFPIIGEDLNFL